MSRLTQAGPEETPADSQCPICLGDIKMAAYVAYCMHSFCFACIRRWAKAADGCPLCRRPLELLLYSRRDNSTYEEYVLGLPANLRRRMSMEQTRSRYPQHNYNLRRRLARDNARSRSPQRRYNLRSRPTDGQMTSLAEQGTSL